MTMLRFLSHEGRPGLGWIFLVGIAAMAGCQDGFFGSDDGVRVASFDSTYQFAYEDPGADASRPLESPAPPRRIGELLYGARAIPEDTSLASEPMSLRIEVTVQNPTTEAVDLPVRGCTVLPRAYASPARLEPPVWIPVWGCAQAPYSRTIEPGGETEFSLQAHDAMLADGLPDGRYYWTAEFRSVGRTLELEAGSGDVRLRVPGLSYHVRVEGEGSNAVRAQVELTNRNDVVTRISYGACALSLRLYGDADRTRFIRDWRPPGVCQGYLAGADVPPGSSHAPSEFEARFPVETVEGLASGRYHLSVVLRHNWRSYEFPVGEMELSR